MKRRISTLIDRGKHVIVGRTDVMNLLHLGVVDVTDAKSLEFALLVKLVEDGALFFQWCLTIRSVNVVYIDFVLLEGLVRRG